MYRDKSRGQEYAAVLSSVDDACSPCDSLSPIEWPRNFPGPTLAPHTERRTEASGLAAQGDLPELVSADDT